MITCYFCSQLVGEYEVFEGKHICKDCKKEATMMGISFLCIRKKRRDKTLVEEKKSK